MWERFQLFNAESVCGETAICLDNQQNTPGPPQNLFTFMKGLSALHTAPNYVYVLNLVVT